jgi:hypothetical protein
MFETVRLIAEHFAQLPRVRAAALVGSRAASTPSPSDWDVWVLCRRPMPREETVDTFWSGHLCPPLLRGMYIRRGRFRVNDTVVECDLWEIEKIQRCLDQVLTRSDPQTCFAIGLAGADCPEVMCHDVLTCQVLYDHEGCLARWKEQLAAYPQAFRAELLGEVLLEARYRLKDLRRGSELPDLPLFHVALSQLCLCLLRMVYAINERYFPGLKRSLAGTADMALLPPDFGARLEQMIRTPLAPARLADILAQVRQLTTEVAWQGLDIGGDVRQSILDPGMADSPDLDPLSLAPEIP